MAYQVDQELPLHLTAPYLETGSWHVGGGSGVTQSSNQC